MWLLPMQHQHEVTQPRLRLIANCPTTRMRSQIGVTTAFTVVPLFGQRMGDHARPSLEHCSMQQTSLPAATVNKCRRNHFNADGNAKFTELSPESHDTSSAAAPFSTGRNGSSRASLMELCIVGVMSLLLDCGFGDHDHADSETDTAIPDDDDDIASFASQPTASLQPSSFQLCPPPGGRFASFFV